MLEQKMSFGFAVIRLSFGFAVIQLSFVLAPLARHSVVIQLFYY